MRVTINGSVSRFYVETLCLLYYPGSKFSDKSESDGRAAEVSLDKNAEGYFAKVELCDNGETFTGEGSVLIGETLSRPSMAEKIAVGRAFLEAGEKAVGIKPPWGILTGVRPSKLALFELEKGIADDDVARSLSSDYSMRSEKASLACSVARAESAVIKPSFENECSVYAAIPFCPTRCSYCSFVSFTSERLLSLIPEYLTVLKRDIASVGELVSRLGKRVTSFYIGGGTPTVLDEKQLDDLLDAVSSSFDVTSFSEFTLEAGRPDTITKDKFDIAASHGVSRVSVNTQTLNPEVLSSIGRRHTPDDFFRALEAARKAGIPNINVDLIAGLPGESAESFLASVDGVSALAPENVTVHTFCVKRSAELKDKNVYAAECATAEKGVSTSFEKLIFNGYLPYYMYRQKNAVGNLENVGYTLPGHEGLYNILMMEEIQPIFAVGASAVSKLVGRDGRGAPVIERIAECKYPYEYLREASLRDGAAIIKRALEFYTTEN